MKRFIFIFTVYCLLLTPYFAHAYESISVSDGGALAGKVTFKGKLPDPTKILMGKDPEVCGTGERIIDPLALGGKGELKDAVIYIVGVEKGKAWKSEKFHLEQKGCRFLPYVGVMENKKKLEVTSNDPVLHNIHTYEIVGEVRRTIFNVGQPNQGFTFEQEVKLRKSNTMKVECDAHNFMHAWQLALENPYYFVTAEDGSFKIEDIPAGSYKIKAWHPTFGEMEKEVNIAAKGKVDVSFEFKK
ncbi:MAG: carboxypeptidase regulatory-like domain-containing protein [Nitrospinae bacterium]|nr:carboxypeptidase regulatory-like domain-containing protein [Nitrospinota bacterium]